MISKLSLKSIIAGSAIILFLTILIQRILYGSRIIRSNNMLIDFLSWIIIYFVLAVVATIISYKLKGRGSIYLILAYIITIVIIIIAVFGIGFGYKNLKINNYNSILDLMEKRQVVEIVNSIEQEEDFILLVTSEDCLNCIEFLPTIKNSLEMHNSLPIYYTKREDDINSVIKESLSVNKIPFMVRIEGGKVSQSYFDNPIGFFE